MSRRTIRIRNHLPEIARALRQIARILSAQGLDSAFIRTINLGIEEVISNIIKYGYDDKREHWIDVQLTIAPPTLELVVVDGGRPFNPLQHPEPDPTRSLDDRRPGGLGITLFRHLFDEIQYRRRAGENSLTLRSLLPNGLTKIRSPFEA
jgi:serine/threonine-protein kinase RsbW